MDSITVDPIDVVQRPTDERGRACLGAEYADANVTVAVVGVDP